LKKWKSDECVVVFADSSAAKRFEEVPASLGLEPAYMYKTRVDNTESPLIKAVTGNVKGRHCLLVDDEILTGNTVMRDAAVLKDQGAKSVHMLAVHGVLADKSLSGEQLIGKLLESSVDEFVVTDSIPLKNKPQLANGKLKVIPIAPLLGEACKRLILGESLSELHRLSA
jgi:ribose-phosphate pyrophosphokinase